MAFYYIPFTSRDGVNYQVRITSSALSVDTALTPGAHPFVVSEDNDSDIFTPVRTQTARIRIEGIDSTTLANIVPTSAVDRPVTLVSLDENDDETTLWSGFLQPATYGCEFRTSYQTVELTARCPLGTLEAFDVPTGFSGWVMVGVVLYRLFDVLGTNNPYLYVYTQGSDAFNDIYSWMSRRVNWDAFLSETDEEGVYEAKYNCKELLSHICTFFGWTARSMAVTSGSYIGISLVLASPADSVVRYDGWQITQFDDLLDPESVQPVTLAWSELDIDADLLLCGSASEEYVPGVKKAIVEASLSEVGTLKLDLKKLEDLARATTVYRHDYDDDLHCFYAYYDAQSYEALLGDFTVAWDYGQDDAIVRFFSYEYYRGNAYYTHYFAGVGELLLCNAYYDPQTSTGASYVCKFTYNKALDLSAGLLVLQMRYNNSMAAQSESHHKITMVIALHIGNYWWTGYAWTYNSNYSEDGTHPVFQIVLGEDGTIASPTSGEGRIADTGAEPLTKGEISGLTIPVSGSYSGKLAILYHYHWPVGDTTAQDQLCLKSLDVTFIRNAANNSNIEKSENKYTSDSGVAFEDEKEVSVVFASDNGNNASHNMVTERDYSYTKTIPYSSGGGGSNERPEQHLANTMAAWGSVMHRVIEAEMYLNLTGHNVALAKMLDNGDEYYPIAQEIDYWDNKNNVKMIKI